jgi:Protein of unknown function (DUF2490)
LRFGVSAGLGLALFCVFAASARADDTELWTSLTVSGPVAEGSKTLLWFDGHARFRDDGSRMGTTILRPGVGWRVNPRLDLWAGYAKIVGHASNPNVHEHRAWQQASFSVGSMLGGSVSLRTRLEQRFRESADGTGWRLRQFIRWARPIESTRFSWVVSDEVFLNLNDTDWGQVEGYGQNRAFAGLAFQGTQNFRLETGYLNNHIDGGRGRDRTNHNGVLAFFLRL